MKGKMILLLLSTALLLSGCGIFDGSYLSVEPHQEESGRDQVEAVSARDYDQLVEALEDMVATGTEGGVIYVSDYDQDMVEQNMRTAVEHIRTVHPVGAYALEDVTYEIGVSGSKPAIAVTFAYRRSFVEIRMIRKLRTMDNVRTVIGGALTDYDATLVMQVEEYEEVDFTQLVKDYAEEHPDTVMETPQVAAGVYGTGDARVIELTFTYQTSRDSLRQMQSQVQPVFDSAVLYVSGEGSDWQKFTQLYSFLMERFDYTRETSITPAYSLLRHGVGDSRAFAVVYAAMCRQAGLECMTVTGTRSGEPWTWNIVLDNGNYYHVDLLRSSAQGSYREFVDGDMSGYVWDYSAYPECPAPYAPPVEETAEPAVAEEPASETEETEEILE